MRFAADIHSRDVPFGSLRVRIWRLPLAGARPIPPAMTKVRVSVVRFRPFAGTLPLLAIALMAAAKPVPLPESAPLGFADVADLTLSAPFIARASIVSTQQVPNKAAAGLRAGRARLLVTARTEAVLVASSAVPATLSWLWDVPLDARGKVPRPRGVPVMLWAANPDADGQTRLVGLAGQQPWSEQLEVAVRALAIAARNREVPEFTGVANGFRADGSVPGESESQFFLTTAGGGTAALVVMTRPGEPRRVAIARGDVIDDSATPVRAGTLLQYRLACFLPRQLPAETAGDAALAEDWRAALTAIGPCDRRLR